LDKRRQIPSAPAKGEEEHTDRRAPGQPLLHFYQT
jgi:hypothetical protein